MFDSSINLTPSSFFSFELDCHSLPKPDARALSSKHVLPDLSELCNEIAFADVFIGWNPQGVAVRVVVNQPYERSAYPEFALGDSVELFIDTRDMKSAGFNTRFCHHFCFLAQPVEQFQAAEVTRFRTEDTHEHCNPKELKLAVDLKKNGYTYDLFIPKKCLVGYDPEQFDRLGFSYKINRWGKPSQHFGITSAEFPIEQYPSLWCSLRLMT
jgi:hypothetical protein